MSKKCFFLVLVVLGEYAMNQKNIGGFVVGLTSTNFGEVRSKFSKNSHTLINTYLLLALHEAY